MEKDRGDIGSNVCTVTPSAQPPYELQNLWAQLLFQGLRPWCITSRPKTLSNTHRKRTMPKYHIADPVWATGMLML